MAELIADCADIPRELRADRSYLPVPRVATRWEVDDACLAQVEDLDEYV